MPQSGKKLDGSKLDGADDDRRRLAAAGADDDGILLLYPLQPLGLLTPDNGEEDEEDGTATGIAEDVQDEDNIGGGVGVKLWESRLCNEKEGCCPPDRNIDEGW